MSGYVDTREGWRELDVVEPDSIYQLAEYNPADGSVVRAWVREAPVPPLPTAPYTVIRVTAPTMQERLVCVLHEDGKWWDIRGVAQRDLSTIAGFKVLAEPVSEDGKQWHNTMRETASDVLDRVRATPLWQILLAVNPANGAELDEIARDFGVES